MSATMTTHTTALPDAAPERAETPTVHAPLVRSLAQARRAARQIAADPAWPLGSTDTAERMMLGVADALGWDGLGWKIAATGIDMQRRLRVSAPVFGRTFAQFLVQAPADFTHAELLDPIVECEFMFRMGRDLPAAAAPHSTGRVAAAVACVHPGVEVGECRLMHASATDPRLLMADGFGSGRYVLGAPLPDWQAALAQGMEVRLDCDGVERRTGHSSAVMGHPLQALVWLANRLAWHGIGLRAGELVSTGSCTGMLRARQGLQMRARFGAADSIALAFR